MVNAIISGKKEKRKILSSNISGISVFKRFAHTSKGVCTRMLGGLPTHSNPTTKGLLAGLQANTQGINTNLPAETSGSGTKIGKIWEVADKSLGSIAKASVKGRFPNVTREIDHSLRDQTLVKCLEILYKTPQDHSNDDLAVLNAFKDLFVSDSANNSRSFQIALEVLLKRKNFRLEDIETLLPKGFSLVDMFQLNKGMVHQSTFFTLMQSINLSSQPGFNTDIESHLIIETVLKYFDPSLTDKQLQQFMLESKSATGNTTCDVILNNHKYDYKFGIENKPCLGKNIIMPVQAHNENALRWFIISWKKYLIKITGRQYDLSTESKMIYYRDLLERVKQIDDNKTLNSVEKILSINQQIYKDLDSRPQESLVPILIPVGDSGRKLIDNQIEKLYLPPTKDTKLAEVKRGYGELIFTLDTPTRKRLYARSVGIWGGDFIDLDNSDIL